MSWIIFIIMSIFSLFFLTIGVTKKDRVFLFIGALFLFVIGFGIFTTGLDIPIGYVTGVI